MPPQSAAQETIPRRDTLALLGLRTHGRIQSVISTICSTPSESLAPVKGSIAVPLEKSIAEGTAFLQQHVSIRLEPKLAWLE